MQRVTITLDDELMLELDRIIAARGYQNRSEAIRDLARAGIRQAAEALDKERDCVAALVYVYDHNARQLSKRLADTFHDHHELSLASMHAHLDHDSCMEVTILRGKADKVQHFGEHTSENPATSANPTLTAPIAPVWTEAKWPFPIDQWGLGKAFVCSAADCGGQVQLYVRPKIGFCNCATGVSDETELEGAAATE